MAANLRQMHDRATLKCVEPEPRLCGGQFKYVHHRFPIKGGITPMKAWNLTMFAQQRKLNMFYSRMLSKLEQMKSEGT